MPLLALNHYFVRARDLERSRRFYCDVLGFAPMPRPKLPFPGHWLGVNGQVQVHMGPDDIAGREQLYPGTHAGSARDNAGVVDHIAFVASDPHEIARRIRGAGLPLRQRHLAEIGLFQLFLTDPDGLTIELNFPDTPVAPSLASPDGA